MLKKYLFLHMFLLLSGVTILAHNDHAETKLLTYIENKNQWDEAVLYKLPLGGLNTLFLEQNAFTFTFYDAEDVVALHDLLQQPEEVKQKFCLNGHAYKVQFLGANECSLIPFDKQTAYHNYFLGNDESRWASKVGLYHGVKYNNLYRNIDVKMYSEEGKLKYDFVVKAGANPNDIQLQYNGVDLMYIANDGKLVLRTSIETVYESQPYTYQIIDGVKTEVACKYVLTNGHTLSFAFPDGYDTDYDLIIDPILVAATLSGTTGSQNYGHCAAFDVGGNIFTGARAFGSGYPTTTGAYQVSYGGGGTDIAISKLTPDGTNLIYATYLGGSGSEYPHSISADLDQNAHIYGSTDSNNYPTTATAFQPAFGGGVDIVVTVLAPDGSIIGSTYVGGSGIDGRNSLTSGSNDQYRGEIISDFYNNTYIASASGSTNFPTTTGVVQPDYIGGGGFNDRDGVVFKLNEDLSEMVWSTYLGSNGNDMCFGLRIDDNEDVYVCGGTSSADFPSTETGYEPAYIGGESDAFIVKLNSTASELLASTFWGTTESDAAFFIDIDNVDDVAIYGPSSGNILVTPSTIYSQAGSRQFITSFDPELTEIKYSTVVGGSGSGFGFGGIVPVAFMVDNCGFIYFSGYSAPTGLETTPDALFDTGGFYLGVLEENGNDLLYATYYTGNHVDGGTSRFDNNGIVYQGVCSGGGFNTTADAWAPDQAAGWDIGVFKIDFQTTGVNAVANAAPETVGCTPLEVDFTNLGSSAFQYFWDFGDGSTSEEDEPIHIYTESGQYEVMLVAYDSLSCNLADTAYINVYVLENDLTTYEEIEICENELVVLESSAPSPEATYLWQDGSTEATFTIPGEGTYWVETSILNCSQIDSFFVFYSPAAALDLGPDTTLCEGEIIEYDLSDLGLGFLWQDGSNSPTYTIDEAGLYYVSVIIGGCIGQDSIAVDYVPSPAVDLGEDRLLCNGETATLDATFADDPDATYSWSNGETTPSIVVNTEGIYVVEIINAAGICTATDEVEVFVGAPAADLGEGITLCDGETYTLDVTIDNPDVEYTWNDGSTSPVYTVSESGIYTVTVSVNGCIASSSVEIDAFPALPTIDLGPDFTLCGNQTRILEVPNDSNVYIWQDGTTANSFLVNAAGLYSVEVTNECGTVRDEVVVEYEELPEIENPILMPTAFSPNSDGVNDIFKPTLNGEIENYEFMVFDRWGGQVFQTTDTTAGWDGVVDNLPSGLGVYAWWCRATVTDCSGTRDFFVKGNTTLIR